jgi:hypothetical protein
LDRLYQRGELSWDLEHGGGSGWPRILVRFIIYGSKWEEQCKRSKAGPRRMRGRPRRNPAVTCNAALTSEAEFGLAM